MPSKNFFTPEWLDQYERKQLERANRNKDNASGTVAVVESVVGNKPLGQDEIQKTGESRFLVRVISVRKRLLDEDNLAEKFLVDCCRNAGLIPDDAPEFCKIEVAQRKVQDNEPEHVIIEIENL